MSNYRNLAGKRCAYKDKRHLVKTTDTGKQHILSNMTWREKLCDVKIGSKKVTPPPPPPATVNTTYIIATVFDCTSCTWRLAARLTIDCKYSVAEMKSAAKNRRHLVPSSNPERNETKIRHLKTKRNVSKKKKKKSNNFSSRFARPGSFFSQNQQNFRCFCFLFWLLLGSSWAQMSKTTAAFFFNFLPISIRNAAESWKRQ